MLFQTKNGQVPVELVVLYGFQFVVVGCRTSRVFLATEALHHIIGDVL